MYTLNELYKMQFKPVGLVKIYRIQTTGISDQELTQNCNILEYNKNNALLSSRSYDKLLVKERKEVDEFLNQYIKMYSKRS